MKRIGGTISVGLTALLVGLAGCASYRPEPLQPHAEIKKLDQRTDTAVASKESARVQKNLGLPDYHPEDGLNEAELVVAALSFNPDLRTRRYAMVGIGANSLFGMVRFQPELKVGIDSATVGLVADSNVFYTLLVPSLRAAWHDENDARRLQARAELLAAESQLVLDTRRAYVAVLAAAHRAHVAEEQERSYAALALAVHGNEEALPRDRAVVDIARQSALSQRRRAADSLEHARMLLNQILGFPPENPVRLTALDQPLVSEKTIFPAKNTIDELVLAQRWELKIMEAEYRHAEFQLSQAIMGQYPHVNVAPSITYDRELGTSVGLGAGVRLPWPEHAAEQAESARINRDRSRANYVARLHELRSSAHDAYDRVEAAWKELDAVTGDASTTADARREFANAWEHHDISLLDYLAISARLDNSDFVRCEAEQNYRLACVELDHAIGRLYVCSDGPAEEPAPVQ